MVSNGVVLDGLVASAQTRGFRGNRGTDAEDIAATRVLTGTYNAKFKIANNVSAATLYEKWCKDNKDIFALLKSQLNNGNGVEMDLVEQKQEATSKKIKK